MSHRSINGIFLTLVTLLIVGITGGVAYSQSSSSDTGKGGGISTGTGVVSGGTGKTGLGTSDVGMPGRPVDPKTGMAGFGRPPSSNVDIPPASKRTPPSSGASDKSKTAERLPGPGPIPIIVPQPSDRQSAKSPSKLGPDPSNQPRP